LKHVFQVDMPGRKISEMLASFWDNKGNSVAIAMYFGLGTIILLWAVNKPLYNTLRRMHIRKKKAKYVGNISPLILVVAATIFSTYFAFHQKFNLAIVGEIPATLPDFAFPVAAWEHWETLILSAFIIALVGFVDSVSVGQTLAAKKRHRVDPDKELLGTGAANIAAGLTGAYPVAGSLSRSALNHATGAKSPLVGLMAALLMALAALTVMPLLENLPLAVLAGLIIYSCFSLLNFKEIWRTWCYSKADALTAIGALFAVLLLGVQYGVLVGTVLSMIFHIRLTLKPHTVEVGRFIGTEHYRDADRFDVEEFDEVKTLRIDESLYFANARFLEDTVAQLIVKYPQMKDLVLMCPAVNRIDASALESLTEINQRLKNLDINLHISEIHSHVMDRLHRSNFLEKLTGKVFMSQHEAIEALRPEPDWSQYSDHIDMH
ncbi:MAG: STAS domain-containing protein, partial [Acidimicrobiales bacterium]